MAIPKNVLDRMVNGVLSKKIKPGSLYQAKKSFTIQTETVWWPTKPSKNTNVFEQDDFYILNNFKIEYDYDRYRDNCLKWRGEMPPFKIDLYFLDINVFQERRCPVHYKILPKTTSEYSMHLYLLKDFTNLIDDRFKHIKEE